MREASSAHVDDAPDASASPGEAAGRPGPAGTRLLWATYALAWATYVAGFVVIAAAQGGPPVMGLVIGATFVLPASALGVGVVHLARRWDWTPERPWAFALRHVAAAAAFSVLWTVGASALRGAWQAYTGAGQGFDPLRGLQNLFVSAHVVFGFLVYGAIAAVVYLVRTLRRLRRERERAARAEALRARAQLRALRARLDPHFLFNALHSVLSLIRRAPERAERAVERLGDLLRYALGRGGEGSEDLVTLGRELEMVRTYLELEEIRFADRLRVEQAVTAEARSALLPPLTVQPLVENAVQHGVGESRKGGTVRLTARLASRDGRRRLEVTVRDDGPGADPGELRAPREGSGISLVRRRLGLMYGDEASLEMETEPGGGVEARLRVPATDGRPGDPEGRSDR
jgi:signal transduction histidine kinase